jgi:hypothetical protein
MNTVNRIIQEWGLKIKPLGAAFLGEWGLFAIVVVACLGSFGLGRLSALIEARPVVSVTEASMRAPAPRITEGGLIVASRSGSAYYYPWCDGALKIAPANQRWFSSEAAARAAGYTPAKNCKGLAGQ